MAICERAGLGFFFLVFLAAGLNILYNLYEWYSVYNTTMGVLP